mgnify:CR=1 FL=1
MDIREYLSIKNIKNADFISIRPFIIGFTFFSLISIWASDVVHANLKTIKTLKVTQKELKTEYIYKRTHVMKLTQRSQLLKRAQKFELSPPSKPLKKINISNDN